MISNFNFVERIQRRKHSQRYHQTISSLLESEVLLRLFPALQTLPLPLSYPDGTPCSIENALTNRARILLCAEPGAGAQLVLTQLAARWREDASPATALPFPIDLSAIDQPHASPLACLSSLLWSQQETIGQSMRLQLLVSGWEHLSALRREAWRESLCSSLPEQVAQVTVIVPLQERLWQGFAPIIVGRPDVALQARWAALLADEHVTTEQLSAHFRPGDRLFDSLMQVLALRSSRSAPRAAASQTGLAILRTEAQQTAAPTLNSSLSFGIQPAILREERILQRAQAIMSSGHLDALLAFGQAERHELALLLNSMLSDSHALLQALWRARNNDRASLQTMACCLREAQSCSPGWAVQICRLLGQGIREHVPDAARLEHELTECLPILDTALHTLATRPRPVRHLISACINTLPDVMAQPRLEWLAYADDVHPALAWDAVQALITTAARGPQTSNLAPEQPEALARWAYVQSMAGPPSRQCLVQLADRALSALSTLPAQRRLQVAPVLLSDPELPQIIRLSAIELLRSCDATEAVTVLLGTSTDSSPMLRAAALQALERHAPEQAQDILLSRLSNPQTSETQQHEALCRLAHLKEAGLPLIEQLLHHDQLALPLRLKLIGLLGHSRVDLERLSGLLSSLSQHPIATGALLQLLALRIAKRSRTITIRPMRWSFKRRRGSASLQWRSWLTRRQYQDLPPALLPTLIALAQKKTADTELRAMACRCLGLIGGPEALACLTQVLEQAQADVSLSLAVAAALGSTRDQAAIPALATLLDGQAFARLRDSVPPQMLREPSLRCVTSPELPEPIARRLALHLARALSEADKPSTLTEYLLSEAELLRVAGARALARINGFQASSTLVDSLRRGPNGSSTLYLASSLSACGSAGIVELNTLLNDEQLPADVRLAAAQALAENVHAEELALRALNKQRLGGMLRGILALGLGKRKSASAGPVLRLVVQDAYSEAYLRIQCLEALSYLEDAASEKLLLQIATNEQESEHVRGAAARALPASMSGSSRHTLISMLYEDHLPAAVIVGSLDALGRAGERELLALTMRYGLDTRPTVVKAAINAMTAIGDDCITPMLIRISQNPHADMMTRLSAIGALLHFDAEAHASLLNSYLQSGQVLVQMQALEHMLATKVSTQRIGMLLERDDLALALRQRVLTALMHEHAGRPTIVRVLNNSRFPLTLRCRAALALGQLGTAQELSYLIEIAQSHEESAALRLSCMQSLASIEPAMAAQLFVRMLTQSDMTGVLPQQAAALLGQSLYQLYRTGGIQ